MDKETMSKQESVKEPVKRFDLEFADPYGFREGMVLNKTEDGDYVFYSDYAALQQRLDAVSGALRECREYFDQRADADQPIGSHPIANEELKMLILIDEALASIGEGV